MALQLIHFSDCGAERPTNQDSYCVRACMTDEGLVAMLAICDGMGGMNCGEVASATVVRGLEGWFDANAESYVRCGSLTPTRIAEDWGDLTRERHETLCAYAKSRGIRMGTTLSVILLTQGFYALMHVGDSRIY